jgi:hypothetical protein
MSAPEPPAPSQLPGPQDWTEADLDALAASDTWLAMKAPPDLIERYKGMHVAVVGEQIVDGDRNFDTLGRRLEARGDTFPWLRVLFRYIPSDQEAMTRY